MNSAATVDNLVINWKNMGLSKAEIVVKQAEAMIGWPYVWGATGQDCTVAKRKEYMNRSSIAEGDKELIKKRCQVLNGSASTCSGCKYYPGGNKTRIQDCQGYIKELMETVGIKLKGGGCTSMWKDSSNWEESGTIDTMPKDKVCCAFKDVNGVKEHILLYDGKGNYIHCSGEVKKQAVSSYKATHWAIPKGLNAKSATVPSSNTSSSNSGVTVSYPTIRQGARGEVVSQLQDLLAKAGSTLTIDGIFGNGTASAVRAFQRKYGLDVDGIVGPKTWTKLLEVAGNIHLAPSETKPADEYVTLVIPEIKESEADELIKKYPKAEKSRG